MQGKVSRESAVCSKSCINCLHAQLSVATHGDRVLRMDQQGLHVVGQPGHLRVRVLHCEENIPGVDNSPFRHCSDPQRQLPTVLG